MRPLTAPFALLVSLVLTTGAFAAPPSAESVEALLAATKAEKMMDSMYGIMEQSMRQPLANALQNQKLNAEQRRILDTLPSRFGQLFREEMSWAKLRPLYVRIYQETFTQDEVDAITAFYKTPAGAASIEKMPAVMQKSMVASQEMMGPMLERSKAMVQQVFEDIKAAQ